MKVLVVDDEPINRDVLAAGLRGQGHEVLTAGDGVEALESLRTKPVDAVIADILMPRMDGYRLCREVRRSPSLRHLPFIFCSATFTEPEDEQLCFDVGGDRVVPKPAAPEEIAVALEESARRALHRDARSEAPGPEALLQNYSERLVRKLEQRNVELADANDELRRAMEIRAAILEASLDSIVAIDHEGRIVEFNRAAEATFRLERARALGSVMVEAIIPARWREAHSQAFARYLATGEGRVLGERLELEGQRADGTVFPIEISFRAIQIGPRPMFTAFIRDITERKRTEEALRASEEHFRSLFEEAADAMLLFGAELTVRAVNPRGAQLLGYEAGELIGTSVTRLVPEEARARIASELAEPRRGPYRREWLVLRRDGSIFTGELTAARLSDGQLLLTVRDVSDRRRAEDALRESERRFNDMLRNLELMALMLDREGNTIYCNDHVLRVLGLPREEVVGQNWLDRFVPPEDTAARRAFGELLADKPSAWHHENEVVTRSGERRLIQWSNTVLRSATGEAIGSASIGQDITLQRQAEEERGRRATELEQFHRLSVGRELRMVELKREVNAWARRAGAAEPYDLTFGGKA